VADQILQEKLKTQITRDVHASKGQIRNYYRSHRSQFHQVHLAHISFSATQFNTAMALEKQINSAPPAKAKSLFAKAAAKYSADTTTASKGGDLGTVTYSQLAPNIKFALKHTKVGNASQPVNTQQGFELFLVLSSKTQTLSQAEQQIRTQVETVQQDAEWMQWLQQRYGSLGVSVNPRFGRLNASSLQVVDVPAEAFPNGVTPSPTPSPTGSPLAPQG
jgi:foldase protein PrsA